MTVGVFYTKYGAGTVWKLFAGIFSEEQNMQVQNLQIKLIRIITITNTQFGLGLFATECKQRYSFIQRVCKSTRSLA